MTRTTMAQADRLGLLLLLLLPVVGTSMPGTIVRLNKSMLKYVSEIGKEPFKQALHVAVPPFLDQSEEKLQPTRVQILNIQMPHLHFNFIPDFGVRLLAAANFTFKVFRVPESLELVLPVVLLADAHVAQSVIRTPMVSIASCFSIFHNAVVLNDSQSTTRALLIQVQQHITTILRNKLCLGVSNVVQELNVHLGTLIGLKPVGPESQISYFMTSVPNITTEYISLGIKAILFLLSKPVILPVDAIPLMLPEHVGASDAMVTLGLSQDLFDSALLLLQKAGALNMDITGELNSDDNLLNTSTLGQLIPQVARDFPKPMPVVLKVRQGGASVVILHANNATLKLQPLVEVLATASNSAFNSLFSLNVTVNLNLQFSMNKMKLQATTSMLGDIQLTVASSNVGVIDPDQVHSLMGTVFETPLLGHLNALLGIGIALPSMINLQYITPEVFIYEGYVVISGRLFYQN